MRLVSIIFHTACLVAMALAPSRAEATPRDEDLFIRPIDQRWVLFGSADAGSSVFVSGGSKQALIGPLDRPGFLALETTGIGLTRENVRLGPLRVPVQRFTHQGSVMGGYQHMFGSLYVAAYAGPELQHEQIAYRGEFARFSKPRLGVRGQVEIWWHPTPETLFTSVVVAGSTRNSIYARSSAGILVFAKTYVGPEITVYSTPTYRETRYGLHATGPKLGIVNLRLSGGVMTDDGGRTLSPYVGVTAWLRL